MSGIVLTAVLGTPHWNLSLEGVSIIIIEIEVQRKFSNLSKVVEDSKLQSWDSNPGHQA